MALHRPALPGEFPKFADCKVKLIGNELDYNNGDIFLACRELTFILKIF